MYTNETRALRGRQGAADSAIDRATASRPPACAEARLVQTTTVSTYPATASAFFACHPVQISGAAQEGNAATYVVDTSTLLYCWNAGTQVPPVGTNMIASLVGGRWCVRFDG